MKTLLMLALVIAGLTSGPNASIQTAYGQTSYRVGGTPSLTLAGTSTLHDWTMTAHSFACSAVFVNSGDNLSALNALAFSLPVHNLKSEHGGMNDNAYDVLKADTYKDIIFRLTSATVTPSGGGKCQIAAHGNLTIAGVTKSIALNASGTRNADGSITITGSVPLALSQFNIERPSFMLGTMKVGDALKLTYNLTLVKS